MKQEHVNKHLWEICQRFSSEIQISNNYIDYISMLLYIRYYNEQYNSRFANAGVREMLYVVKMILGQIQEDSRDIYLFSNINFKMSYISMEQENTMEKILKELREFLFEDDVEQDQIAIAYDYIIEKAIERTDIVKADREFYTPKNITDLAVSLIIKDENSNIYDPICGSGNFLSSAYKYLKCNIYGQENKIEYYNICKTRMLLNKIQNTNIFCEGSYENNMTYDIVLSNPPFSQRNWQEDIKRMCDYDIFYKYGLPKGAVGDYAYVLSMLKKLKDTGKMAVILPYGVLFRETEKMVRENLVEENNIEAIIALPENLFYTTRIPVIIMILCKQRYYDDSIFFIDASSDYIASKKNNYLKIDNIIDVYKDKKQVIGYSYLACKKEIRDNNYNLMIKRYVQKENVKENVDKVYLMKEIQYLEEQIGIANRKITEVMDKL